MFYYFTWKCSLKYYNFFRMPTCSAPPDSHWTRNSRHAQWQGHVYSFVALSSHSLNIFTDFYWLLIFSISRSNLGLIDIKVLPLTPKNLKNSLDISGDVKPRNTYYLSWHCNSAINSWKCMPCLISNFKIRLEWYWLIGSFHFIRILLLYFLIKMASSSFLSGSTIIS